MRIRIDLEISARLKRTLMGVALVGFVGTVAQAHADWQLDPATWMISGGPISAGKLKDLFVEADQRLSGLEADRPPIGAIIAWHKSFANTPALPIGGQWVECNGQTINDGDSPYNDQVIPNLNGDPSGAALPGQTGVAANFLRGGLTSGAAQQDAFQGHTHSLDYNGSMPTVDAGGSWYRVVPAANDGKSVQSGSPKVDGAFGTPRTAAETRPVNMAVVWIMRIK
ncbi:MAG: hypothetical protein U0414_20310 [Polyangiaceae bacterium]